MVRSGFDAQPTGLCAPDVGERSDRIDPFLGNRRIEREEELRRIWGSPETRKALLEGLADRGFADEQLCEISKIISAERSDVFDVLAYIAFAMPPISRHDRVESRKPKILSSYDDKLQLFLDYVLSQYVKEGVGELDQEKLPALLQLKYRALDDAANALGGLARIREAFVGFQRGLYE